MSEAARVICLRGQAMAAGHGHGTMAAVEQSIVEVEQLRWVREGALLVAAENGPHSCTLSGEVAAIKELAEWGEQALAVAWATSMLWQTSCLIRLSVL